MSGPSPWLWYICILGLWLSFLAQCDHLATSSKFQPVGKEEGLKAAIHAPLSYSHIQQQGARTRKHRLRPYRLSLEKNGGPFLTKGEDRYWGTDGSHM